MPVIMLPDSKIIQITKSIFFLLTVQYVLISFAVSRSEEAVNLFLRVLTINNSSFAGSQFFPNHILPKERKTFEKSWV